MIFHLASATSAAPTTGIGSSKEGDDDKCNKSINANLRSFSETQSATTPGKRWSTTRASSSPWPPPPPLIKMTPAADRRSCRHDTIKSLSSSLMITTLALLCMVVAMLFLLCPDTVPTVAVDVDKVKHVVGESRNGTNTNDDDANDDDDIIITNSKDDSHAETEPLVLGIIAEEMMEKFSRARTQMMLGLRRDYGEDTFAKLFLLRGTGTAVTTEENVAVTANNDGDDDQVRHGSNTTRFLFRSPAGGAEGPSWDRIQRKFKMKVIQSLFLAAQQQQTETGRKQQDYGVHVGRRHRRSFEEEEQQHLEKPRTRATESTGTGKALLPFVWASGGHSAAAGHGNFHDESYTAVLGRAAGPAFSSAGMHLIARNRAMGGTSSGPEIAACSQSVFGNDLDVLSWDYGMTDGRNYGHMAFYFARANVRHPGNRGGGNRGTTTTRPINLVIGASPRKSNGRVEVVRQLERRGLAAVYMDEMAAWDLQMEAIPDCMGMTEQEILELPDHIRNLKCQDHFEEGEPGCAENKWNDTMCKDRKFKVKWHPGWKMHALKGNFLALFLIDTLNDALQEVVDYLAEASGDNMEAMLRQLLQQLQRQEQADDEQYDASELPPNSERILQPEDFNEEGTKQEAIFNLVETMYKAPNTCHTARLPSEIRYRGILTEGTTYTMKTVHFGDQSWEEGVPRSGASSGSGGGEGGISMVSAVISNKTKPASNNNSSIVRTGSAPMLLVYDDKSRPNCPVPVQMDYQDYFYVNRHDAWQTVRLPNDAELHEYHHRRLTDSGDDEPFSPLHGVIAVCLTVCPWGRCPKGSIDWEGIISEERAEFLINGERVTRWIRMPKNCALLIRGDGDYYWNLAPDGSNEDGRFEIAARVREEDTYIRINSIMVW